MVLAPIEFIDGIDELKKVIKPCGDDMSRKVNQAFKLAHKTIHFEDLNDWLKEFIKNNSNKNSLRNNHQCTSREEMKELQVSVGAEEKKELHQEDRKSLPNEFEKYEETSHENEEYYLETVNLFVTSECIHPYILCIVPRCLFWDVSVMYLSHVMP